MDLKMGQINVLNPAEPKEPKKSFTFDMIYNWECTQRMIYDETAAPMVNAVLEGFNGTGKTFTMQGVEEVKELRGIIPNSFEHIFDNISLSTGKEYLVRASYLEIYNENIRDLLSKNPDTRLDLKEHPDKGVYVKDLSEIVVSSVSEIDAVMQQGSKNRSVGFTLMNAGSSRSHSIFTITIESSTPNPQGGDPLIRAGRLNLVDLAGSERQGKTGAEGLRLVEATKINLSLTALGNVMSALVEGKSKHIPYRDSKLTRLLQDSLGGNAKTSMIANLGPADYNYDETIGTLRWANRAKNIKNKPKVNEDPKDAMLRQLQEELEKLKAAIANGGVRQSIPGSPSGGSVNSPKVVIRRIVKQTGIDADSLEKLKSQKDSEIQSALQEKGIVEEERERIVAELRQVQQKTLRDQEEHAMLQKKIALVQNKLISGNLQDEAQKQEAEIRRRRAELEKKQLEKKHLERELAEKQAEQDKMEEKFTSLTQEVEEKTKKLKKLWTKFEESKNEIRDQNREFATEREDLLDNIRELTVQLKLKNLMIDSFIPEEEVKSIEQRAEWNEEMETWVLSHKKYLSNKGFKRPVSAIGLKRPVAEVARSAGVSNPRYRPENIVQFELEMPDRTTLDYESAEPRIKATIQAALTEEEDVIVEAQDETEEKVQLEFRIDEQFTSSRKEEQTSQCDEEEQRKRNIFASG
ncbi:kinesin-II 95 kDa subunit [Planoprotostelium fungivorum]|uniref:Kinesin-like protein n=1 Tax=Planoprotostelium fungivorum TaxID=1890364 RepID=A0A2P6N5Q5_9EUKA|nr:kinesin-II 95 kDa subunit [Planoprotostelium fungivorum]